MKWKKNVFTGFWWIISYVLSSVALAAIGVPFLKNAGLEQPEFRILLLCLLFVAEIVLFFLLHSLVLYFRPQPVSDASSEHPGKGYGLIFGASVLFIIGMALAVRIGYVSSRGSELIGDLSLYEHAKVSSGGIPLLAHNGTTFYVGLLSVILSFSGNNPETVIYFQTVLQCVLICLTFFFVKMTIGRAAAVFASFAAAFAPNMITELNIISPGTLMATAIMATLCIAAAVLRFTAKEERCGVICVLHWLFLGLFTGGLIYLDISGILVCLIIFSALVFLRFACGIGSKIVQGCMYLCGVVCAVALLLWMEAELSAHSVFSVAETFLGNQKIYVRLIVPVAPSDAQSLMICMMLLFVSFGMFGFFKQSYDRGLMAIVLCVLSALGVCLDAFPVKMDMLGMSALIMTASCGVQFFADLWVGEADADEVCVSAEEQVAGSDIAPAVIRDAEGTVNGEQTDRKEQERQDDKNVRFIPNPLPVPKRHVRRELDFGKEVADEDMKYDIEVSADDDFDIK